MPTVLLCIGATKAGTTWLYRHLAAHPDCHLRSIKELHYFNTLEGGDFGRELRRTRRRALRLRVDAASDGRAADLADWLAVLQRRALDVPAYLGYLGAGAGERRLVADVTPAYAGLPVQRLAAMARMAEDVRFLYLLRDPVARLWSHVRMVAARAAAGTSDLAGRAHDKLARILAGEPSVAVDRSDYAGTLSRLSAAVPRGQWQAMFLDDLGTAGGRARLWSFLGIEAGPAGPAKPVFSGADIGMTADEARRARAFLAPQYAFVEAMFGALPPSWQHPQAEVAA